MSDKWYKDIQKNSHTPGPWRICKSKEFYDDGGIYIVKGKQCLARVHCEEGFWLAQEQGGQVSSYDVWKAAFLREKKDAWLIAAAPELLECLEGLVKLFREPTNKVDFQAKLSAARSLIKKAKGEE